MDKEGRLTELAHLYVANKNEADSYAKLCKDQGDEIKKLMQEMGLVEIAVGEKKLTCTVSNRVTLDEDKVLAILQSAGINNSTLIRTKQYVDMNELEKAIYAGLIDSETVAKLNDAKVVSPDIVTLRILREGKRKKNED